MDSEPRAMRPPPTLARKPVVVMGVAGCGKTAVGRALAERLDAVFIEGDHLHSPENVARMQRGEPLTDELRADWLVAIGRAVAEEAGRGLNVVATCSALKRSYRDRLRSFCPDLAFLYLKVDPETATARVASRSGHFMPASLVGSQFAILEEPRPDEQALALDASQPVAALVEAAAMKLPQA
jgi:gluconokinase